MHLLSTVSALALVAVAAAQNPVITVGGEASAAGGIFQYIPPFVNATNGTVVTFRFAGSPGNHSVTQSAFASPCQPEQAGFDSGFVTVPAGVSTDFTEWNLTITNDQKPIWFYCKQLAPAPHCKAGMVGGINVGNATFAAFQAAAMASSGNPGQQENGLSGVGASASAPPGPFSGGVTGVGNPTAASAPAGASATSAASGTSAAPSSSSSGKTGAATHLTANFANVAGYAVLGAFIFSLA